MPRQAKPPRRTDYHHGNLRQTLIDAALQLAEENLRREFAPRTLRADDVDLLVSLHRAGGQLAALQQGTGQILQTAQLLRRRRRLVEIPDEADAKRDLVLRLAAQMPAVELFLPAIAHGDFAVAHAVAIADDEMVGKPVFHVPDFSVVGIHAFHRPGIHVTVVNHDILPPALPHRGLGDGRLN